MSPRDRVAASASRAPSAAGAPRPGRPRPSRRRRARRGSRPPSGRRPAGVPSHARVQRVAAPGRRRRPDSPRLPVATGSQVARVGRDEGHRGSGEYAVTGGRRPAAAIAVLVEPPLRGGGPRAGTRRPTRRRAGSSAPSVTSNAPEPVDGVGSPGTSRIQRDVLARRRALAGLERRGRPRTPRPRGSSSSSDDAPVERRVERLGDQPLDDPLLGRLVAGRSRARSCRRSRRRPRRGRETRGAADRLAEPDRPLERGRLEHLDVGDRDADADARSAG